MNDLTYIEEGEALRKKFDILKKDKGISRASFAESVKFKGGDSMVYQHITGRRPMNMESAVAYAKYFACDLKEISQRLAHEAENSAAVLQIKPKTQRESRIEKIASLLNEMDDSGLAIMLDKAKDVASEYPVAKQTQSYS